MITYGSVCSGIESASVAWEPLGYTPFWFSEIEPFPCAVLEHHWPRVPNLGDMSLLPDAVRSGVISAPDVLVGGTPCQAFSVAGKQNSLADARGGLSLIYGDLLDAIDEQRGAGNEAVCLWENVPGVLSTKDNAFGHLLGLLAGEYSLADCLSGAAEPLEAQPGESRQKWPKSGCVIGPKRTVAWRVLDAQYFGLAQRRKRVFVVASARDGFDPSEVLFEREGVRRDIAPSREAGQETARGVREGSHWDDPRNAHPTLNQCHSASGIGASNQEVFSQRGSGILWPAHLASTLNAAFGDKLGLENQHINGGCPLFVPCTKRVSPMALSLQGSMIGRSDAAGPQGSGINSELSFTLNTTDRHAVVAFAENSRSEVRLEGGDGAIAGALSTGGGKPGQGVPTILAIHDKATRHQGDGSGNGLGVSNQNDPMYTLTCGDRHSVFCGTQNDALRDVSLEVAPTLRAGNGGGAINQVVNACEPKCFQQNASGELRESDVAYTLNTNSNASGRNTGLLREGALPINTMTVQGRPSDDLNPRMGTGIGKSTDPQNTLSTAHHHACYDGSLVRRLTPLECERLQGFPENHTLIPYGAKQKLDAEVREYYSRHLGRDLTIEEQRELVGDGSRYKAIGNSKAVPVVRWLGERIAKQLKK